MNGLLRRILRALGLVPEAEEPGVEARGPVALPEAVAPALWEAAPDPGVPSSLRAAQQPARVSVPDVPVGETRGVRFLLTVDDAGEYLLATGDQLVLGHLRAGRADLPFLADVGIEHALMERTFSLRAGLVWTVRPLGKETVRVGSERVSAQGRRLSRDDVVRLGNNLAFRFRVPDPASHTVLLELLEGAECAGARKIILFGDGEGGRVRIGSAGQRHIRVANLQHEISLIQSDKTLIVRCEDGVRSAEESADGAFALSCPPTQRFDLSVGRAQGARPPFGLAIAPAELPEREGSSRAAPDPTPGEPQG